MFGLSHPVWAKNNAGKWFYIFLNFFTIFFRSFPSRVEYERNSGVKFYFLFFSQSPPVLGKNNGGKRFYNFLNFFTIFFRNFLARLEYERNSGEKFYFHFFSRSPTDLAKNKAGKRFYNFLNFCTLFFGIFLSGSSMNGTLESNFVFSLSAYLIPLWLKIMAGRGFIVFWIFLQFFRNFPSWVEYERYSGVKFYFLFFSVSPPVLAKNNGGKRFYNFFNFFTIFFGIFLPGSSINSILE